MLRSLSISLLLTAASAAPAAAEVEVGGYLQPQLRLRQNDDVAQFDEDGFRLRRARTTALATWTLPCAVEVRGFIEGELTPQFELLDAFVEATGALPRGGAWRIAMGQVKAPFSRQTLVSDADLQLVEKAALTELAPDRQLGVAATLRTPVAPVVVSAGAFNGEGRNLIDNADENLMYVARVAVVLGEEGKLVEGAFGPDRASVAGNVYLNRRDLGDYDEETFAWGVDGFVSWRGLSATAEYVVKDVSFDPETMLRVPFQARGVNAQAGWLLPWLGRRLELAARFEEIDRNDAVPITQPGDDYQSTRTYALGVSWYQREHALKAQLLVAHVDEVEDVDSNGDDATYDNDLLLLQLTMRLE